MAEVNVVESDLLFHGLDLIFSDVDQSLLWEVWLLMIEFNSLLDGFDLVLGDANHSIVSEMWSMLEFEIMESILKSNFILHGLDLTFTDVDQSHITLNNRSVPLVEVNMVEHDLALGGQDLLLRDVDQTIWWWGWRQEANLLALLGDISLEAISSWSILGDSLTLSNKHLEVFHGIGVSWAAVFLEVLDQVSVAIIITWSGWCLSLLDCLQELWSNFLEKGVDLHSLVELLLESFLVLFAWRFQDF